MQFGRPGIEERAERSISQRRDFLAALRGRTPAVIAEIKKASPSKGVLAAEFDPAAIALLYEEGGAAALSVLTDEKHFQGSLSDLGSARGAVGLPTLRKDFTIDTYHVHQAAAYGADAILLIAAILTEREMREFRELAEHYGMAALVEVHDAEELEPAVASGARLIGVNNRNLHTFKVSLETSIRLAGKIPEGVVKVAESANSFFDWMCNNFGPPVIKPSWWAGTFDEVREIRRVHCEPFCHDGENSARHHQS